MSTELDKQAIKLWRKEWSTDMKSAMWSGTEVCRFAAAFASQVRERSIAETNQREIDAIREGYKAEICGRCKVVVLAHKHFIRCENSPCPMKDGIYQKRRLHGRTEICTECWEKAKLRLLAQERN